MNIIETNIANIAEDKKILYKLTRAKGLNIKDLENGERVPVDVMVGDHVLFSKHANLKTKIDGVEYLTMHEADIVGVLDEDDQPGNVEFEIGQDAVEIDHMIDR